MVSLYLTFFPFDFNGPVLINDMQTLSPQKWPNRIFVSKCCTMFYNEWKNNFPIFAIFSFWYMVDFVLKILKILIKKNVTLFFSLQMRNVLKLMLSKIIRGLEVENFFFAPILKTFFLHVFQMISSNKNIVEIFS